MRKRRERGRKCKIMHKKKPKLAKRNYTKKEDMDKSRWRKGNSNEEENKRKT